MATIKSYTDISQSKKLAKILPLESADMVYICIDLGRKWINVPRFIEGVPDHADEYDIYAWSLAALLGVLPNSKDISTTLSRGGWKIEPVEYVDKWWCEYEDDTHTNDLSVSAGNPIDACYELILKLNALNLL